MPQSQIVRQKKEHSPSSPLENVPPEIISQVFLAYHATLNRGCVRDSLLNICLTCQDWRDLVYSMPELWATLDVVVQDHSKFTLIGTVEAWLRRSHQRPLTIFFTVYGAGPRSLAVKVLDLLLKHIRCWYCASFDLQLHSHEQFPVISNDATSPILESFSMKLSSQFPALHPWMSVLARSPKLHTFRDIGTYRSFYIEHSPLAQLLTLEIKQALPPSILFKLISSMPHLNSLNIQIGQQPHPYPSVDHVPSAIRSLKVSLTCYSALELFLSKFDAPNLEHLEIHLLDPKIFTEFTQYTQTIINFLGNTPGLRITSFAIRNLYMKATTVLQWLAVLSPHLQRLDILADILTSANYNSVENFTERIISALTYNPDLPAEDLLCPKLEHLTLERCVNADDGMLSEMVYSRWRAHHPVGPEFYGCSPNNFPFSEIRFFGVVFRYHTHPADTKELEKLRREGLKVHTEFGYSRLREDPGLF